MLAGSVAALLKAGAVLRMQKDRHVCTALPLEGRRRSHGLWDMHLGLCPSAAEAVQPENVCKEFLQATWVLDMSICALQDFRRIAQFLDGRTTGDCVVHYYRTQKLDEFAAVRRKMQLKKRRMQSENNRAVSYMGVPMPGAAKRGELAAIANPGTPLLPSHVPGLLRPARMSAQHRSPLCRIASHVASRSGMLSFECIVQTLAGCSRRWCRCLRRCPACAAGPSPVAPAGQAALQLLAPQRPAPQRPGASLAPSWQEEWWKRSCSKAMRTGRLQMRGRQQRLPSALAGKPMTLLCQMRFFGRGCTFSHKLVRQASRWMAAAAQAT